MPPYPGGYPAPPAPYGSYPAPPKDPGKTMGIVGLVLSFFGLLSIAGLIVSIIARGKSKKAGYSNGLAVAGIIVSIVVLVISIVAIIIGGAAIVHVIQTCRDLGPGSHLVNGITYNCS